MKLCLFQGTFNPIHNAHLQVCDYAKKEFGFDKIMVIPAARPPHKELDEKLSNHRLEMTKIATKSKDYLEVSDIEYKREGLSYTYLTIKELYKKYKIDGKINFIIGTDAFKNIESWYESDKLKELVDFVLFIREDESELEKDKNHLQKLKNKGYNYRIMKMPFIDISSTQIRENISNSIPIKNLVPKEVGNYIDKHGLYKNKYWRNKTLAKR